MSKPLTRQAVSGFAENSGDVTIDVYQYHQRSKHALQGYAAGPETIDWDNQPDPFRRFNGAPLIELPFVDKTLCAGDDDFFTASLNTLTEADAITAQPITLSTVARWLQFSLALTACKQYGTSSWSLRCNPSSGNLHPGEAYLIIRGLSGLADGLYHYRADLHALEQRCRFLAGSTVNSPELYLGFSSVQWREAWKYGERAYRYCQLDIGHAMACCSYAAALNGWSLQQKTIGSDSLATLLGVDRVADFIAEEGEHPDVLLAVNDKGETEVSALLPLAEQGSWQGSAEVIDKRHFYQWPVIDAISQQAVKPDGVAAVNTVLPAQPPALTGDYLETLAEIIPLRRSAQAFNGDIEISREQFFVMLDRLLPREQAAPWCSVEEAGALHCVLFVHRVSGLEPGLYALPRSPKGEQLMRKVMRQEFNWQPVTDKPDHLPLYQLIAARAQRTAAKLSCQQAIAADGVFSLAMLADFSASLSGRPWRYPELFWEAGVIGQVLYLEAEGIGLQGTGIGCYFDDAVHELLGIDDDSLQVMYHFTVGSAVRDPRIVSFAPYGERRDSGSGEAERDDY